MIFASIFDEKDNKSIYVGYSNNDVSMLSDRAIFARHSSDFCKEKQ
jgi:hypothetical protein